MKEHLIVTRCWFCDVSELNNSTTIEEHLQNNKYTVAMKNDHELVYFQYFRDKILWEGGRFACFFNLNIDSITSKP